MLEWIILGALVAAVLVAEHFVRIHIGQCNRADEIRTFHRRTFELERWFDANYHPESIEDALGPTQGPLESGWMTRDEAAHFGMTLT